jgi:hypothetical protein
MGRTSGEYVVHPRVVDSKYDLRQAFAPSQKFQRQRIRGEVVVGEGQGLELAGLYLGNRRQYFLDSFRPDSGGRARRPTINDLEEQIADLHEVEPTRIKVRVG